MKISHILYSVTLLLFIVFAYMIYNTLDINGNGYEYLSAKEKRSIIKCHVNMDSIHHGNYIYQVSPEVVKRTIKCKKEAIIYEYLPFCKAAVPPQKVLAHCKNKGISLYIISSTYDHLFEKKNQNISIFVIDHTLYENNDYQEYSETFYNDIAKGNKEQLSKGLFHYFKNGKYIRSYHELKDF